MEWVETTAKTIDEARERALEVLGVAEDDAEIEVLEEPRAGLFGLVRGEARVRARVRPTEVRPKIDRRRGRRTRGTDAAGADSEAGAVVAATREPAEAGDAPARSRSGGGGRRRRGGRNETDGDGSPEQTDELAATSSDDDQTDAMQEDSEMDTATTDDEISPEEVGQAAVQFVEGLLDAFDLDGEVALTVEGSELEVEVTGSELGLLIGPGGRTLLAVQDLTRVAAQRRLGDHETRLRVDVAGYRSRRREALERFARSVAEQVIETGRARSLEPMPSADRKVIHDVLMGIDGVTSRSEGDDPDRRVVVLPQ